MVVTISIDRAGRVVIPKAIREHLGLRGGTELELTEFRDGVMLRLVSREPSLVEVDGLWVHRGAYEGPADVRRLIDQQREERIRSLLRS